MKKVFLISIYIVTVCGQLCAQNLQYDHSEELKGGLYKVKSGEDYGVVDSNGCVKVSVEYDDIRFREGKALLIKNELIYGVIDSLCNVVKSFDGEYKVHPAYRYVYEDFILVSEPNSKLFKNKWGFIRFDGEPLRMANKIKGVIPAGKTTPALFDDVAPFVGGIASVYIKKLGWIHIDQYGKERFVLPQYSFFRSSVYNGDAIIVTHDGIRQYQENNSCSAVVKRVINAKSDLDGSSINVTQDETTIGNSRLILDSLKRVVKYEDKLDSIVFIEKPRPVIVQDVTLDEPEVQDTLSVTDDIKLELKSDVLRATAKGFANVVVVVSNLSQTVFSGLNITIECMTVKTEWEGEFLPDEVKEFRINIPARFSSTEIKRDIKIRINYMNQHEVTVLPVVVKRYTLNY